MFAIYNSALKTARTSEYTPIPQKTYRRFWKSYNNAQKNEKVMFMSLLRELCDGINEPEQHMGRKRVSIKDAIFCIALKNYTTLSGRRNNCDIQDAFEKGFISQPLAYNTIFKYMQDEQITDLLKGMIETSAQSMREIETDFGFDSTGFSTPNFVTWHNVKWGGTEDWHDWYKLHVCAGLKTGIIASFEISERAAHDSQFFKPLFESAKANGFTIKNAFADKGYPTRANLQLVVDNDATPYIRFRGNAKYNDSHTVWNKMLYYFLANKDEFYSIYNKRNNIEAGFSAMKRKFGNRLTSRIKPAQINELLAKILAYNLCVVTKVLFELDINPSFSREGR